MSVALYLDENVPLAVVIGLRLRRVDVMTVQEDQYAGRADDEVLERANELERVVFTQDADFLREAHRRQQESRSFSGVI